MPTLKIIYRNPADLVRLIGQLTSYAVVFAYAFVSSRAKTAATVVALRSQLARRADRVQHRRRSPSLASHRHSVSRG